MKDSTRQKLEGQWDQVRGKIRETWGDLTDNDLQRTKGQAEQVVGVIKERTGESRQAIEERLDRILDRP